MSELVWQWKYVWIVMLAGFIVVLTGIQAWDTFNFPKWLMVALRMLSFSIILPTLAACTIIFLSNGGNNNGEDRRTKK